MKTVFAAFLVVALVAVVLGVVITRPGPSEADAATAKKQLLIYCGITMIQPMTEIARVIEQQEGCEIIITKGGSGNLLRAIKVNKLGDLYLPGSDSYIKTCKEEGLVSETVHVGYNKAAIMVQKDNPKSISNDLRNLASPDYYVVICNPNSGSIGRETRKILERAGIFDQVSRNASQLTIDSKDLVNVLRNKEADLVINWYATSTWPDNEPYVNVLSIDEQYAFKKKLVLGLLTFSKHPDIAGKFMAYASSEKGRALFEQYGLFDVK